MNGFLYEDEHDAVTTKLPGADSETSAPGFLCVHRLDKGTGGVMVYAKTPEAAAKLSASFGGRDVRKVYLAVAEGVPDPSGRMEDLLFHDRRNNKTYVADRKRKGVREASLSYELLGTAEHEGKSISLVRVTPETGRTHQIRIQFASRKLPLAGDARYGSSVKASFPALWAVSLTFPHPETGERMTFTSFPDPDIFPWSLFRETLHELKETTEETE